ncbi:MAG: DUF4328 domain-containing protein, partial [Myxococcales bacterium]|nr:DUF4328 domain-containing protein [Myxococcales bacterium]
MHEYVSARARAQLVDVLLAAQIALYALRVAGAAYLAVDDSGALATMSTRGERMLRPFLLLLFIGTAIAFLSWLYRAARNLPSLTGETCARIAAEHVVGVFFAPLVNLFAAPYVVYDVWLASDPTPPRRGWLVLAWWPPLVAAWLTLAWPLVSGALLLGSALSLVAIVRDVQRRQDEQFLDGQR